MRILLRPFDRQDFQTIISWIETPEELFFWSATNFVFPLDEIQLERHLNRVLAEKSQRLAFQAIAPEIDRPVGHIELARIDLISRQASLAFFSIAPQQRRKGFGKATLEVTIDYCFNILALEKIDLYILRDNTPALHCYESVGFEIEATIDDKLIVKDEAKILYLMGLKRDKRPSRSGLH